MACALLGTFENFGNPFEFKGFKYKRVWVPFGDFES